MYVSCWGVIKHPFTFTVTMLSVRLMGCNPTQNPPSKHYHLKLRYERFPRINWKSTDSETTIYSGLSEIT